MDTPPEVIARNLGRRFGSFWAVKGLDMVIPAGQVTGLIGPNGAGKSTTLQMVLGLMRPTQGVVSYAGLPLDGGPDRIPSRLRALIESPAFDICLSARENLSLLSAIAGDPVEPRRLGESLEQVGLGPHADRPIRTFSTGMLQRLAIAWCFSGRARFLVLDEPANGLDPEFQVVLRELLQKARREGHATVIVSSHHLKSLEEVVDHIVFIHSGRVLKQGCVEELLAEQEQVRARIRATPIDVLQSVLTEAKVSPTREEGGAFVIDVSPENIPGLVRNLVEVGADVHEITLIKRSLEDLYMDGLKDTQSAPEPLSLAAIATEPDATGGSLTEPETTQTAPPSGDLQ